MLRLGFIGGGVNSAIGTTHKIAAQMDNRFLVYSGCFSRHEQVNKKTAKAWNITKYDTDFINYLNKERENLDAVVVLTPTDFHTPVILEALQRNLPVICEKTLTDSVADAKRIKTVLEQSEGFLAVTYNYTGYPMIRELEAMIRYGRLGKIIQVNIQMPQESFIRLDPQGEIPIPQSWRLKDGTIATISLDLGTHLSNMVSFLTGAKPLEVVAKSNSYGHFRVTDNVMCLIRYTEEIDCQMWYSKSALGQKNGLKVEIYGTEGSATWYQMDPEFLEYNDKVGRHIRLDRSSPEILVANLPKYNRFKSGHPAGFIEAFANHYIDIYDSLIRYQKGDANPYSRYVFNIEDSLRELSLMEAIERSRQSRTWEAVNAYT
ncbi:Gfo/Idh/MocA family oxidoreductase [Nitratifractor sp.]|uniref:Gfo/Idh/MocA family protein n=1 Tax=Nitratifractor sp. TaxID=2268144 RepID=UPI0025D6A17F|nr:Gfo/Idh/MocA family oxidoreductase [Nitratifractor sp.]